MNSSSAALLEFAADLQGCLAVPLAPGGFHEDMAVEVVEAPRAFAYATCPASTAEDSPSGSACLDIHPSLPCYMDPSEPAGCKDVIVEGVGVDGG